jgi:RNA polymerase sigma factor (sigma-70 family)
MLTSEIYRFGSEDSEDLSSIRDVNSFQHVKVRGNKTRDDKEFNSRLKAAERSLTPTEQKVFKLMVKEACSIREAARKLNISASRAQQCWNNIREKLQ